VPYVTVINPATLTVTNRFPIRTGMGTDSIKVDPSTDVVYLGAKRELTVGVYDPFSFAAVNLLDTGAGVVSMTTDTDENNLYLVTTGTNRVLVYQRIRKSLVGELDVGDDPSWISVMAEN
jgi:DNA-binding beta-propeller fold protein YncE